MKLVLALIAFLALVVPAQARVLWTADADTPGSWDVTSSDAGPEWASTSERPDRPGMVIRACMPAYTSWSVRQGNCSYRFETDPGDYGVFDQGRNVVRAEVGQGNPGRAGFENRLEQSGSSIYFGFYVKRPEYPVGDGVEAMMQDKTVAPWNAPQFESYSTDRTDGLWVSFNNWKDGGTKLQVGMGMHPEPAGAAWYRYVVHLVHKPYPNGVIDVWFGQDNGQPLTRIVHKTNADVQARDGRPSHVRVGIYGSDSVPRRILYIDGFRAGTTYADVVPQ